MFKTITKHSAAELDAPMKHLGRDGLNSLHPLSTFFLRSVSKLHIVVVVVVAIVVAVVVVVIVAVVIVVVFNIITGLFPIV